jgi:hypothetical protein
MPSCTGCVDGVSDVLAGPLAEIAERHAPKLRSKVQLIHLYVDAFIISSLLADARSCCAFGPFRLLTPIGL